MLTSAISGFVLFVIAVCVGPALLIAGWQTLNGERVRLPSVVKPLMQSLSMLAVMLLETAEVVANMVAEKCPPKHAHWRPAIRPAVKLAIIGTIVWLLGQFLLSRADR